MNNKCDHCHREIELSLAGGSSCILDIPECSTVRRFCCLACLFLMMLDDLGVVGKHRLPNLDNSWFPVMNNLHDEIMRGFEGIVECKKK
jgi:hypothetical protein